MFSAVKRLIMINHIQNQSLCLCNICVYCVYLLCIYKYTHAVYILKISTCIYMYMFVFLYFILYINI